MDELLARVAAGDHEAMRELYYDVRPRLWRYLAHHESVDRAALDDLLQEIFVAIWRSAPTYRPLGSPLAWIYAIARHHVSHALRDRVRRPQALSRDAPLEEFSQATASSVTMEFGVLTRLELDEALSRLSPLHREVLLLAFEHGFSAPEVAQILAVPLGTVKSRLSHARRALLRAYASADFQEETP